MNEAELEKLNEDTFLTEAKESIGKRYWRQDLEFVLADDFALRRSAAEKPDENRAEMIQSIDRTQSPPKRSIVPGSVRVWSSQEVGVVTSTVTLPIQGETKAFGNVKVFARESRQMALRLLAALSQTAARHWVSPDHEADLDGQRRLIDVTGA